MGVPSPPADPPRCNSSCKSCRYCGEGSRVSSNAYVRGSTAVRRGELSCGTAASHRSGARCAPPRWGCLSKPRGAGPPTWASDRGEGARERYTDFGSGSAVVLGNRGVARVWGRLSAVILSYVSQTSSAVAGLLWAIVLDGFWWSGPTLSNIIDQLAQVLLICVLNELTFVLAHFVFCQNSGSLQWACSAMFSFLLSGEEDLVFHWFLWASNPLPLIDPALNIHFFLSSVGVLNKNMYS